jgi:predicted TIM-barrel fold metal-dependent hydrolase
MLIDAHAHIFPRVRGQVGAGPTRGLSHGQVAIGPSVIQALPPPFETLKHTPDMLVAGMNSAGVDWAILLQGPFYGECNAYVSRAVRKHADRLIGAAFFDPWSQGPAAFERLAAAFPFRILKLEFSEATGLAGLHPQARLSDPAIAWLWRELARRQWVLVIDMGAIGSRSYQTHYLRQIAEAHPDLKIVIAHLAQPNPRAEADGGLWRLWQEQIDLAHLPNLWFDTASLPAYVPVEDFPFPTAERYLRMALDRVGPEKVMWGTDVPALLTFATYQQLARLARTHVQHLSPADQELVLSGNARSVFGIG